MNFKEKKLRQFIKPLTKYLKKTNISAEQLTLFRILSGLVVAIILFSGNYAASAVAILIYQFILLLDYVDGPIARFRKTYKKSWVYLDHVTHLILSVLFILAITFSTYLKTSSSFILVFGFLAALAFLFNNSFNKQAFLAIRFKKTEKKKAEKESAFASIFKIEEPFSLFFLLVFFNLRYLLLILYGVVYIFAMIYKLLSTVISLEDEK